MKRSPIVVIDPEILSGTPVFAGTRVPVRTLIDYLRTGHSLERFLEGFPTVSRDQAIAGIGADEKAPGVPQEG